MKSEKIIIELKDLSKIYQMGEEISVKALDHINLGHFPSQYSHTHIKSSSRFYTIFGSCLISCSKRSLISCRA